MNPFLFWAHLSMAGRQFNGFGGSDMEARVELNMAVKAHCEYRDEPWDRFVEGGYLDDVCVLPVHLSND